MLAADCGLFGRSHQATRGRSNWTVMAVLAAVTFCGACSPHDGDSGNGQTNVLHILALPPTLSIHPGGSAEVTFTVMNERDQPVTNHPVEFTLVAPLTAEGEAETSVAGATLSHARAFTDASGKATVRVHAGLVTTFLVRARAGRAMPHDVPVAVVSALHGDVELAPALAQLGGPPVSGFNLRLYDNQTCVDLQIDAPTLLPVPVRQPRDVPPMGGTHVFLAVSTTGTHAAVALGLDTAGVIQYAGCVDIPGTALVDQHVTRVLLPVHGLAVHLAGLFNVTSEILFDPEPPGVTQLVTAWTRLSACPLDPAQIWLDCIIDALGGTNDADPLDCVPNPVSGSEGPLASLLNLHRGVRDASLISGTTSCRTATDAAGRPSLEKLVHDVFAAGAQGVIGDLPILSREMVDMTKRVQIHSRMAISPPLQAGIHQVDHTLDRMEIVVGQNVVTLPMSELSLDSPRAPFVSATHTTNRLALAQHGFTLRLGRAFREAFTRQALDVRTYPTTPSDFVAMLYDAFVPEVNAPEQRGCMALDALLCVAVGEPTGCLIDACIAGQMALAEELGRGFDLLDGEGLDLLLAGTIATVDTNGDRQIDRLGQLVGTSTGPGLWAGQLRTRGGNIPISGFFLGQRAPSHN